MNIGIVVYSHTGHTLAVARKCTEALCAAGHEVTLERVEPAGPVGMSATRAELKTKPAIDAYDAVVFGTPVRGGVPAAPMASYLDQLPSLQGKQIACLVTGFFPAGWGRTQTLGQMEAICASKGATVCGSGSVGWFSLGRKRRISQVVDRLSACFVAHPGRGAPEHIRPPLPHWERDSG